MGNTTYKTQPKNGQSFAVGASSARNTTEISADSVTVHSSVDCFFKIGNSGVVASSVDYDMHLIAGVYMEITLNSGQTHIAAIRDGASNGTFYINEEK